MADPSIAPKSPAHDTVGHIEGYLKEIEILLGCLKVELSVLRGQQIIAEDERRGGNRSRR